MQTTAVEDVLKFWFPSLPDGDRTARVRQWDWWFCGGGDTEIAARFSSRLERAIAGELDDWEREPRSRLALILILDQFSRKIYHCYLRRRVLV